jgi:hypothetical protein
MLTILDKITKRLKDLINKRYSGDVVLTIRFVNGGIKYSRINVEENL